LMVERALIITPNLICEIYVILQISMSWLRWSWE
jgi:hypothetical protein